MYKHTETDYSESEKAHSYYLNLLIKSTLLHNSKPHSRFWPRQRWPVSTEITQLRIRYYKGQTMVYYLLPHLQSHEMAISHDRGVDAQDRLYVAPASVKPPTSELWAK